MKENAREIGKEWLMESFVSLAKRFTCNSRQRRIPGEFQTRVTWWDFHFIKTILATSWRMFEQREKLEAEPPMHRPFQKPGWETLRAWTKVIAEGIQEKRTWSAQEDRPWGLSGCAGFERENYGKILSFRFGQLDRGCCCLLRNREQGEPLKRCCGHGPEISNRCCIWMSEAQKKTLS